MTDHPPELNQFCDPDHASTATVRRAGRWWVGTDGKIIAWVEAEGDAGVDPKLPSLPGVIVQCLEAKHGDWIKLPEAMPVGVMGSKPCPCCYGKGTLPAREECDDCNGTGSCLHCGHECEECDGEGYVENDRGGENCPECGGLGTLPEGPQWLYVCGHSMKWSYVAMLVRLRACVCASEYRGVLRWEAGRMAGFLMPMIPYGPTPTVSIP